MYIINYQNTKPLYQISLELVRSTVAPTVVDLGASNHLIVHAPTFAEAAFFSHMKSSLLDAKPWWLREGMNGQPEFREEMDG